jgi:hypothetical protein
MAAKIKPVEPTVIEAIAHITDKRLFSLGQLRHHL